MKTQGSPPSVASMSSSPPSPGWKRRRFRPWVGRATTASASLAWFDRPSLEYGGVSMEPSGIDSVDFRHAQHRHWSSAAAGWNAWSEFNDRADRHISERLVELAGVQAGNRVLDIAAGYGEPALTAAGKAGPEGRVVATDISAEMLAFGRERA